MTTSTEKAVPLDTHKEIEAASIREGKTIDKYPVKSKHGAGLWLEIKKDGSKRFRYRYRLGNKRPDMDLGYFPSTSLATARKRHGEAVAMVKQGIDPKATLSAAKVKNVAMPTLAELFAEWLAMKAKTKTKRGAPISARTLLDYQRVFDGHLGKKLGKVRVCDLSRSVIFSFLEDTGAQEATRKSLVLLNQILDRAVDLEHIELNPARTIKPAAVGGTMGQPRERHLLVDELAMLWRTLGDAEASATSLAVADCLRLIMLTGVRRAEAAGMRFDQIEGDRWTIPVTKNGRAHVVTLHPLAMEILERQRKLSAGPWVFASTSNPMVAVTADAVTKALDRIRVKHLAELEPFHVHDLRRSVATGCGEYLDAPERLIEKLLNHQVQDRLVRTYQAGEQAEKLRRLWLDWGDWVAANVAQVSEADAVPDNVVVVKFGGRA